jgi:uncharacterized membrane protein YdjX (TVP38/TMEM64 family)
MPDFLGAEPSAASNSKTRSFPGLIFLSLKAYFSTRLIMPKPPHKKSPGGVKHNLPLIIGAGFLCALVILYFLYPPFHSGMNKAFDVLTSEDDERIQAWVSQFGLLGPLIIILVMIGQMFTFLVPNILIMIIAIISYGPVWGGLLALLAVFSSSSIGYYIGTRLSPVTLQKFVSLKTQKKISEFIEDYGVAAIIITRLSSFSNDALGFVAGILNMGYKRFILSTMVGITPLVVLLAIYGNNGRIERALIWIAAASLITLFLYIKLHRRKKRRKKSTHA